VLRRRAYPAISGPLRTVHAVPRAHSASRGRPGRGRVPRAVAGVLPVPVGDGLYRRRASPYMVNTRAHGGDPPAGM